MSRYTKRIMEIANISEVERISVDPSNRLTNTDLQRIQIAKDKGKLVTGMDPDGEWYEWEQWDPKHPGEVIVIRQDAEQDALNVDELGDIEIR